MLGLVGVEVLFGIVSHANLVVVIHDAGRELEGFFLVGDDSRVERISLMKDTSNRTIQSTIYVSLVMSPPTGTLGALHHDTS